MTSPFRHGANPTGVVIAWGGLDYSLKTQHFVSLRRFLIDLDDPCLAYFKRSGFPKAAHKETRFAKMSLPYGWPPPPPAP